MPDSMMYREDAFVLLETNQPEQLLTREELLERLKVALVQQEDLPRDLQRFSNLDDQVNYLLDTSCELDVGPGKFLQWYVVRLEK